MSEQATLLRTLKMLMLLNHNFGRSVQELARLCDDINPRTVCRYINTLRDVGFVICQREDQCVCGVKMLS